MYPEPNHGPVPYAAGAHGHGYGVYAPALGGHAAFAPAYGPIGGHGGGYGPVGAYSHTSPVFVPYFGY